jgi:TonB dependent receptor
VLGYEIRVPSIKINFKMEAYYQYLFDIAVEKKLNSGFSTLNMDHVFDLRGKEPLVSTGKGKNYGVDITAEHPVNNGWYYMLNLSLFKSDYTNYADKWFNSRFARSYNSNFNIGKEWTGRKKKNRVTGVNVRLLVMGGLRESVIDLPLSIISGKEEYVTDKYFSLKQGNYFRSDMSIYIRTNKKRTTKTLSLELQNVTNRANEGAAFFDKPTASVKRYKQLSVLLPVLTYKIQFGRK